MAVVHQPPKEFVRTTTDLAYVIQAVDGNRIVKVGRSADPMHRIKGIRCNIPFEVKLIAILNEGKKRESEMKSLIAGSKIKGEWFTPDDRLNDYLLDAARSKAIVVKSEIDDAFFKNHILPLVLEYLNGRNPTFTDGGDFVYRIVHAGFDAAKGRFSRLMGACPKTFTPELLAGYIPAVFDADVPKIVIPSPAPSSTEAA